MTASDAFELYPPTTEDLDAAEKAWRDATARHDVSAGTVFWRTLKADSRREALEYSRVCYRSKVPSRFSPVEAAGTIVPAAYAASTDVASLWETALRNIRHEGTKRVPTRDVNNRYLVQTRTTRDLKLLDLRRPSISNLVTAGKRAPELTAAWPSAYATTRAWAQALYLRIPDIDGFIYESHQVSGDCIVLFQPGDQEIFETLGEALPLNEDPVRALLRGEARRAGATVDFGDVPDAEAT